MLYLSESGKLTEHSEDVFPGSQFFLRARTKSIHLFLLLVAMALSEFRKGILYMLIPFTGSATLSHRAATHLSGIFRVYSKTLDGIQVRAL